MKLQEKYKDLNTNDPTCLSTYYSRTTSLIDITWGPARSTRISISLCSVTHVWNTPLTEHTKQVKSLIKDTSQHICKGLLFLKQTPHIRSKYACIFLVTNTYYIIFSCRLAHNYYTNLMYMYIHVHVHVCTCTTKI